MNDIHDDDVVPSSAASLGRPDGPTVVLPTRRVGHAQLLSFVVLGCAYLIFQPKVGRYIPVSVDRRQARVEDVHAPLPPLSRPARPAWEKTSWIGDVFVPPPGARMYPLAEIRRILGGHSILFVGDSTGRRLWTTCMQLLNVTGDDDDGGGDIISREVAYRDYDLDPYHEKALGPHRCPKWDADPVLSNVSSHGSFCPDDDDRSRNSLHFLGLTCYWMVERLAQQSSDPSGLLWNATQQYSVIVTSVGIWENLRHKDCAAPKEPFPAGVNRSREHLQSLVLSLDRLALSRSSSSGSSSSRNGADDNSGNSTKDDTRQRGLTVIWRTSGFSDRRNSKGHPNTDVNITDNLNQLSIDLIENTSSRPDGGRLTYLDWGSAIRPRSFGTERIQGDMHAHYGAEARLLMVQMLVNALDGDRGEDASSYQ